MRAVPDPLDNFPSRYDKSELQEATEVRYGATTPISDRDIGDEEIRPEENASEPESSNADLGTVDPI